jgi:hypothetical protein
MHVLEVHLLHFLMVVVHEILQFLIEDGFDFLVVGVLGFNLCLYLWVDGE